MSTPLWILGCILIIGVYYNEACTYQGKSYRAGDIWTAADGCNQCTCGMVGSMCTRKEVCKEVEPTTTPRHTTIQLSTQSTGDFNADCIYRGQQYRTGDIWTAADGCNRCTCGIVGSMCTTNPC